MVKENRTTRRALTRHVASEGTRRDADDADVDAVNAMQLGHGRDGRGTWTRLAEVMRCEFGRSVRLMGLIINDANDLFVSRDVIECRASNDDTTYLLQAD